MGPTRLMLPLPPSVNRLITVDRMGRLVKRQDAITWAHEAQIRADHWRQRTHWRPIQGRKIVVDWWIWWPDAGVHDPSNLEKVLWDALEGILYDNDRWILPRCQDFAVDAQHPRIELALWARDSKGEDTV